MLLRAFVIIPIAISALSFAGCGEQATPPEKSVVQGREVPLVAGGLEEPVRQAKRRGRGRGVKEESVQARKPRRRRHLPRADPVQLQGPVVVASPVVLAGGHNLQAQAAVLNVPFPQQLVLQPVVAQPVLGAGSVNLHSSGSRRASGHPLPAAVIRQASGPLVVSASNSQLVPPIVDQGPVLVSAPNSQSVSPIVRQDVPVMSLLGSHSGSHSLSSVPVIVASRDANLGARSTGPVPVLDMRAIARARSFSGHLRRGSDVGARRGSLHMSATRPVVQRSVHDPTGHLPVDALRPASAHDVLVESVDSLAPSEVVVDALVPAGRLSVDAGLGNSPSVQEQESLVIADASGSSSPLLQAPVQLPALRASVHMNVPSGQLSGELASVRQDVGGSLHPRVVVSGLHPPAPVSSELGDSAESEDDADAPLAVRVASRSSLSLSAEDGDESRESVAPVDVALNAAVPVVASQLDASLDSVVPGLDDVPPRVETVRSGELVAADDVEREEPVVSALHLDSVSAEPLVVAAGEIDRQPLALIYTSFGNKVCVVPEPLSLDPINAVIDTAVSEDGSVAAIAKIREFTIAVQAAETRYMTGLGNSQGDSSARINRWTAALVSFSTELKEAVTTFVRGVDSAPIRLQMRQAAMNRLVIAAHLRDDLFKGIVPNQRLNGMNIRAVKDNLAVIKTGLRNVPIPALSSLLGTHSDERASTMILLMNGVVAEVERLARNISGPADAFDAAAARIRGELRTQVTSAAAGLSGINILKATDAAALAIETTKGNIGASTESNHAAVAIQALAATIQTAVHYGMLQPIS